MEVVILVALVEQHTLVLLAILPQVIHQQLRLAQRVAE
jgi:hypothetical protein